jgi:hypothetical protein
MIIKEFASEVIYTWRKNNIVADFYLPGQSKTPRKLMALAFKQTQYGQRDHAQFLYRVNTHQLRVYLGGERRTEMGNIEPKISPSSVFFLSGIKNAVLVFVKIHRTKD